MIKSTGEMGLDKANEMNVPVCLFIHPPEDSETAWTLTADNYMPRKNFITEGQYEYHADSKEELLGLVQKYVIPLYEAAIRALKQGKLYFWEEEALDLQNTKTRGE